MASTTTQMLRDWVVVGSGLVLVVSARVRSSPRQDAPKMVAPVWYSSWSPSARRVMPTEAQPTMGVCCWVPKASLKKMMLVSLDTGRRAIAVGWYLYTGFPLGASGGVLCELKQRGCVYAYLSGDDGLGPWAEAEEALVWAALCDVRILQVEEVSRVGVEPLARDGLSSPLLFLVAAQCWAFVLQGAHGCLMRACS